MDERIDYALAVLMNAPNPERFARPSWLTYGAQPPAGEAPGIHIQASGFFGDNYGTPASLPPLPLEEIEKTPLLFGKPIVERRGKALIVHADIVASAYFLVTRYEEWVRRSVRDRHGRFPGRESLAFRAGFLLLPVVDEYAALLRKWAKDVGIEIPAPRRQFSALLTHDVHTFGESGLVQAARCVAGALLRRRPFRQGLDAAAAALRKKHPLDNLDEVLQLDRSLTERFASRRCRSIWFFMAGGNSPHDDPYVLESAKILSSLRYVLAADAEIALHASYEAGAKPELVKAERLALEKAVGVPVEKNRHHFLGWREPEHGEIIAEAGIRWDSTLGYADAAGFRLGVCRPIPLFDPIRQKPLGIEEHPLIVMDCTLNMSVYMNLDEEAAFGCVRQLMDATFRHRGEFIGLWHNTELASDARSYHKRLYPRVLNHLKQLLENDR